MGDCNAYYSCVYGCEVWGGDRSSIQSQKPSDRQTYILNSQGEMFISGMTQEKKCILEKCNAYCAREAFGSCKESQYEQECLAGNYLMWGCDVDSSRAVQLSQVSVVAAAVLAVAGSLLV